MTNLQQKLTELLNEMQNSGSTDFQASLNSYLEEDKKRFEEIAQEQKDISDSIKEILRYDDMTFANATEEAEEFIRLDREAKQILRKQKELQSFVDFLKKGAF